MISRQQKRFLNSLKHNNTLIRRGCDAGIGNYQGRAFRKKSSSIAIEQLSNLLEVTIFPNPTEDRITIEIPNMVTSAEMYIYGTDGKLLMKKDIDKSVVHMDISEFPAGLYLVNVISNGNQKAIRLVKK